MASATEMIAPAPLREAGVGSSKARAPDGTALSGQWGGQFYGNGDGSTQPGSVAGTFGAVSADDSRGLIGAFGAHKQ